jgi:hypothetical protein
LGPPPASIIESVTGSAGAPVYTQHEPEKRVGSLTIDGISADASPIARSKLFMKPFLTGYASLPANGASRNLDWGVDEKV